GVGTRERELLVDSGSDDAVDDELIAKSTEPLMDVTGGVGLGKTFRIVVGHVPKLKLGGLVLEDMHGGATIGGARVVPLPGGCGLRRFTAIFDFSRQRLILEPNSHFRDAFAEDRSGLHLECAAGGAAFVVREALDGSPAAEAGIRSGDLVTDLDGAPAA